MATGAPSRLNGETATAQPQRAEHLQRGVRLEAFTVAYNVVEAALALTAAWLAGSVALLGFGFDSIVETMSGGVLFWRLRREQGSADAAETERVETRAQRLVAASLVLLGLVVAVESTRTLVQGRLPEPSLVGIGLTALSVVVMFVLARAKRRTAQALDSRAMEGDAFHTDACFWISLVVLVGLALNAWQGWWWADPAAALAIVPFLASEARELWDGE